MHEHFIMGCFLCLIWPWMCRDDLLSDRFRIGDHEHPLHAPQSRNPIGFTWFHKLLISLCVATSLNPVQTTIASSASLEQQLLQVESRILNVRNNCIPVSTALKLTRTVSINRRV